MQDDYCRTDLIHQLDARCQDLTLPQVELAVKALFDLIIDTLGENERVEIRGFGSFSLHIRAPRIARNPKTGEQVTVTARPIPHFKPSKLLRESLNP